MMSKNVSYNHSVSGTVREGRGLSSQFGWPTANIDAELPFGIYTAETNIESRGAVVAAVRSGELEVHVIGFEGELVGEKLSLTNIQRVPDIFVTLYVQNLFNNG